MSVRKLHSTTVAASLLLGIALVLAALAGAGVAMENAYRNATPRINPATLSLCFFAASCLAWIGRLLVAPLAPAARLIFSLLLLATGTGFLLMAFFLAFFVG